MEPKIRELRVKVKSLAGEARVIRAEERKAVKDAKTRDSLNAHRVIDVRREQRATLLAYAYLRGRAYKTVERKCKREPDWTRVRKIASKFGVKDVTQTEVDTWRQVVLAAQVN